MYVTFCHIYLPYTNTFFPFLFSVGGRLCNFVISVSTNPLRFSSPGFPYHCHHLWVFVYCFIKHNLILFNRIYITKLYLTTIYNNIFTLENMVIHLLAWGTFHYIYLELMCLSKSILPPPPRVYVSCRPKKWTFCTTTLHALEEGMIM